MSWYWVLDTQAGRDTKAVTSVVTVSVTVVADTAEVVRVRRIGTTLPPIDSTTRPVMTITYFTRSGKRIF